jgi:hypothetical protein
LQCALIVKFWPVNTISDRLGPLSELTWRGAARTYLLWGVFCKKNYRTHLSVINFYFFLCFIPKIPSTTYIRTSLPTPYVSSNSGGRCTAPPLPIPPHSGRWSAALTHSGHLRAPLQQSGRRRCSSWGGRGRALTRHRRRRHGRPQASFGRAAPAGACAPPPANPDAHTSAAQLTCCARRRRPPHLLRVPPPPTSPGARAAAARLVCWCSPASGLRELAHVGPAGASPHRSRRR